MGSPPSLNSLLSSVTASLRQQTGTRNQVEANLQERSRITGKHEAAAVDDGKAPRKRAVLCPPPSQKALRCPESPQALCHSSLGGLFLGHPCRPTMQASYCFSINVCCADASLSSPLTMAARSPILRSGHVSVVLHYHLTAQDREV